MSASSLSDNYDLFYAGEPITLEIQFVNAEGAGVMPTAASYTVVDENGSELVATTSLNPSLATGSPPTISVTIPGAQNTLSGDAKRGYRELKVEFSDGTENYRVYSRYLIQTPDALEIGVNSFGTYGKLLMQALELPDVETFDAASDYDKLVALHAAFTNIGRLRIPVSEWVYTTIERTSQLSESDFFLLPEDLQSRLLRAQVVEANAILGGSPIEERRRLGMQSESHGEHSEFFRITKPLELPVSRETIRVIGGYVRWSPVIGRG